MRSGIMGHFYLYNIYSSYCD